MSDKMPCEVLTEARNILVKRGWTQGVHQKQGRVCAQAAVNLAAGRTESGYTNFTRAVIDRVGRAAGTNSVARWNDTPGRKKSQVLAAFDKAIEACK